jgi:hypothetical protein
LANSLRKGLRKSAAEKQSECHPVETGAMAFCCRAQRKVVSVLFAKAGAKR